MKNILTILALFLTSSMAMAEEGVGDAFDISCIDKERFTVTVSGEKEIYDRGPTTRYTNDGSVQCEVGGDRFQFAYMIREPIGHGACGGMPMLYFDLHLNGELKAKFHKFGSYCFNSVEKLDIVNNSAGVSSIELCGETTIDKEGALISIDGCVAIFLKDYVRIKFDPKEDHMAQVIDFKESGN